ncbi:MAG: hypothetical protein IJS73_01915 [Paludibacteraceae bacterium]|nr:hypothetical protein [Paludibacteraceae bacterium]
MRHNRSEALYKVAASHNYGNGVRYTAYCAFVKCRRANLSNNRHFVETLMSSLNAHCTRPRGDLKTYFVRQDLLTKFQMITQHSPTITQAEFRFSWLPVEVFTIQMAGLIPYHTTDDFLCC